MSILSEQLWLNKCLRMYIDTSKINWWCFGLVRGSLLAYMLDRLVHIGMDVCNLHVSFSLQLHYSVYMNNLRGSWHAFNSSSPIEQDVFGRWSVRIYARRAFMSFLSPSLPIPGQYLKHIKTTLYTYHWISLKVIAPDHHSMLHSSCSLHVI